MKSKRIYMTEGVEAPAGTGKMILAGGHYYLLPQDMADELVASERAYPDGDPPTSSDGTVFEGIAAYDRRAAHEARLAAAQEAETDPLDGVEFASDAARALAVERELTAADFDADPSGATGFTVADVRAIGNEDEQE